MSRGRTRSTGGTGVGVSESVQMFVMIDLMPMLAAVLAAVCCGVLGNFLVLRRQSLMGDAISHAVLPGIVGAFAAGLVIGAGEDARHPVLMLGGAAVAGLVTVGLIGLVERVGRVERGAAMGVVFSVMFAGGLVGIRLVAKHVDLETLVVYEPVESWGRLMSWGYWMGGSDERGAPVQVRTLLVMTVVAVGCVVVFFKELRIASFDPQLSSSLGVPAGLVGAGLMVMVAAATVASFEAVGSILVIAMLIVPACVARLVTDRLWVQVVLSVIVAVVCAVGGYWVAVWGPGRALARVISGGTVGSGAVSVSGMVTVMGGAVLVVTAVASPTHGIVIRRVRRLALAVRVVREDVLAVLYRVREERRSAKDGALRVRGVIGGGLIAWLGVRSAVRGGLVAEEDGGMQLTRKGVRLGASIVRSHRLWERYLVERAGVQPDHVHDSAMILEHARREDGRFEPETQRETDPHNRPIPRENEHF